MGSLMAGWDSPFNDPKKVKLERNKSLTKEGIEAYWKSQKKDENEHQEISKSPKEPEKYQRSSSLPLTNRKGELINLDDEVNLEKLILTKGWWTRSTSAFLNEPPVIASDAPTHKYASQYHVAAIADPNSRKGISA